MNWPCFLLGYLAAVLTPVVVYGMFCFVWWAALKCLEIKEKI